MPSSEYLQLSLLGTESSPPHLFSDTVSPGYIPDDARATLFAEYDAADVLSITAWLSSLKYFSVHYFLLLAGS
jgi:hypothetical protein